MRGRTGVSRDRRARGGRSSRGADETLVFEPPSRRGGGGGRRGGRDNGGREGGDGRARLLDLCSDWLSMIVALRQASGAALGADTIRTRTLELKARLEQDGARSGVNAVDVEAAVFALIAFLDESVLRAGGPARDAWIARPMQLELFGTNVAGDEFFDRLDRLRRERESRIEAIEVYACCLAFGFLGRFGMAGPERIQQLLAQVEGDINAVRGTGRRPLAPHADRPDDASGTVAGKFPLWMALAVFVPALLLFWLVLKLFAVLGAKGAAGAIARMIGAGS